MIRALLIVALALAADSAFADGPSAPAIPAPAAAAKPPEKPVVKKLFSGTETALGQKLALPQGNAEVTVLSYEIPPGAKLPVHKHPHPRYAYVLAGRLKVSTGDDAKSFEYGPGDFIVEMLDAWHGETLGPETVKLLVIDQAPPGETNTVLKQ
jgi:quercetin dioxygenase-like cupin family protein